MIVLFCIMYGVADGQHSATVIDDFFRFTNAYRAEKLAPLVAEDFEMMRTYAPAKHDKNTFLYSFIPGSKACHGKHKVLKILGNNAPRQFLVEDQSDYLKYFGIDSPTWIFTIVTKDNLIQHVTVDTNETYRPYRTALLRAHAPFIDWLKANYLWEYQTDRYFKAGRLSRRLREYVRQRDKGSRR
jgi:hypothetical protein